MHITLTNDTVLKKQNALQRDIAKTTDVLSFPAVPPQKKTSFYQDLYLGDILISLDRARLQAKQQNVPLREEVLFLILHSVLHLLGFDHGEPKEAMRMQKWESRLWRRWHA